MSLDGKVSEFVDVVSVVPQSSFLWQFLFILYTSELFHVVGTHIVCYADDPIYDVIPRPLSHSQVMKSLNLDLVTNQPLVFDVAHKAQP